MTRRFWAIVFVAASVLLIPTVFTAFPELAKLAAWLRLVIVVLWLIGVFFVARSATERDLQLAELLGEPIHRRRAERDLAAKRAIQAVLRDPRSPLSLYIFRLFAPDPDVGLLLPIFQEETDRDEESWEPGKGATGQAFQMGEFVLARGSAVNDASFGLSLEQQEKYSAIKVVAAMPIRNARREVIGVLTASSDREDNSFDGPEGEAEMVQLAQVCARLLIDLEVAEGE